MVVRNDGAHVERAGGRRLRQHRDLARPRPARRPEGLRHLRRRDPRGRGAAARRLPRPPGHRRTSPAAEVVHAPEVMHGRLSAVYHDDSPLFAGIPQGFTVVRYHSLCVTEPLPEDLEAIAWTADGVVMGAGPPHAAGVGRPVPPRVDLHRAGAAACSPTSATSPPGVPGGKRTPLDAAGRERRRHEVVAAAAPAPAPAGRAHRPRSTTPSRSS